MEFVSRLFSKPRPDHLGTASTAEELFNAFAASPGSAETYAEKLRAIRERLVDDHQFPITENDLGAIAAILKAFYRDGVLIHYTPERGRGTGASTYRSLMTSADEEGQPRSYLASEDAFAFVKLWKLTI